MYSSSASRMIVARDVRSRRAMEANWRRCPVPSVIVNRSAFVALLPLVYFIGNHHNDTFLIIMVLRRAEVKSYLCRRHAKAAVLPSCSSDPPEACTMQTSTY